MDPFTILQTVGAAGEVTAFCLRACNEIYKFSRDVKTIRKTLDRIEDEVVDLDRTQRMVAAAIKDPAVTRIARSRRGADVLGADILSIVQTSCDRSVLTLERLKKVLSIILGEPGDSGTMKPLRQTLRSKRQQKELNECISQMEKSKQNLNLCLTTLSVHMLANLSRRQHGANEDDIAPLAQQLESVLNLPKPTDDNRIRRTAVTVLERAKSPPPLPPPSDPGISRSSTLREEERCDEDDGGNADLLAPATSPDIWMKLLESSRASAVGTRRASTSTSYRAYASSSEEDEPDLDDTALVEPHNEKFQISLVRGAIQQGNRNYNNKNYEQAAAQLEEALKTASMLSKKASTFLERDLIQVRLNIGDIYALREESLDSAEEHLLQAAIAISEDTRGNDNECQHQLCTAYSTLARVYMLQRRLDDAESYAEDAINGHLALDGPDSSSYYRSLQLLIQIYMLQGNHVRPQLLLPTLPPDLREKVKKQMQMGPSSPQTSHGFAPFPPNTRRRPSVIFNNAQTFGVPLTHESSPPGVDAKMPKVAEASEPAPDRHAEITELAEAGFSGDYDADKALAWAVREGRQRVALALISHPGVLAVRKRTFGSFGSAKQVHKLASVNGSSKKEMRGQQPLMLATTVPGRVMLAKLLLERGADVGIKDEKNRSLLEVAAAQGQQEIISVLLDHGAAIHNVEGMHAFHLAAQNGHINVLSLFLDKGMEPDIAHRDHGYGRSALMTAAGRGQEQAVDFLIRRGADPNLADKGGSTPLMASIRERHEGTMKLLLKRFANVNLANRREQTALIIAAEQGQLGAVQLILEEQEVEVDHRDSNGWTALIWACDRGQYEIVRSLLAHGQVNVNAQCYRGSRALDHPRGNNSKVLIDLLRSNGAIQGTGAVRRGMIDETYKGYVFV